MKQMKELPAFALVTIFLTGCATVSLEQQDWIARPGTAKKPDEVRLQANDSRKIVNYFDKINPPHKPVKPQAPVIETISIGKALARYVPQDYRTLTSTEIDAQQFILYDGSRPWIEALGKSLEAVNVELTVNLSKKILFVKPLRTTIGEVLEKHVPIDYKVYADSNVNLDSFIRYDSSLAWYEALGKPLADAGIEMTANVNAKLMSLRQIFVPGIEIEAGTTAKSPAKSYARQPQEFENLKLRLTK